MIYNFLVDSYGVMYIFWALYKIDCLFLYFMNGTLFLKELQ